MRDRWSRMLRSSPRLSMMLRSSRLRSIMAMGPTDLFDGDALGDRKLEPLGDVGDDLCRSRLDEARRMNAVLHGVRVARMRGNEGTWISVVHLNEYVADHHAAINGDPSPGHFKPALSTAGVTAGHTGVTFLSEIGPSSITRTLGTNARPEGRPEC